MNKDLHLRLRSSFMFGMAFWLPSGFFCFLLTRSLVAQHFFVEDKALVLHHNKNLMTLLVITRFL